MRKAPQQKKKRHIFSGLNYISQVIIGFVFISAFTVLIAIGVISIVWNQYFQMYTDRKSTRLNSRSPDYPLGISYAVFCL